MRNRTFILTFSVWAVIPQAENKITHVEAS